MLKKESILEMIKRLNVDFSKFTIEDFLEGIDVELEHGLISPSTNITNDDLEITSKIALAHLNEHSNYYNKEYGIRVFEKFLDSKLENTDKNK